MQNIGAAVAFLGCEGLIVPSARLLASFAKNYGHLCHR